MRALLVCSAIAAAGGAAACSHPPAGEVRYVPQAPVWRVNDRIPFDQVPDKRTYTPNLYHFDGAVVRRVTRAMDLVPDRRAADVNSLDEVPDSTWFTNRIGVRDLTDAELAAAGRTGPNPFEHLPWTIKSAKIGGMSIGFVFEDARGDKYLVKFDRLGAPEMETGAHMVTRAILWACGYNVADDYLGYLRREDLQVAADATRTDAVGDETALTVADLDAALAKVDRGPDGLYRVMASRFVPGKPIGPFAREGRRGDDPNDTIPHERRRVLRGQSAIFAWLDHSDLQEGQAIDTFVPEAPGSKRGFVMHYLIDFGKSLGVMAYASHWRTAGYTYRYDARYALQSLIGLGLWIRPWDSLDAPPLRGIGLWTATSYDPGRWRPSSPYWPIYDRDRFDAFWGSKILIRFSRAQLASIIEQAKLSDPKAAAYMLDVLVERQRRTARYWFERVSPLDAFAVEPDPDRAGALRLCFDDLSLRYELGHTPGGTRYALDVYDYGGAALGEPRVIAAREARTCVGDIPAGTAREGYTIAKLAVQRDARALPPVRVHLARTAAGRYEVIGLRRE
jgi:hypothetical protein